MEGANLECSRILILISLVFISACSSPKILSVDTKEIKLSKKDFKKSFSMISMKGGDLVLGPRVHIDEGDKRKVIVKFFSLAKLEVTQLQWVYIMKSNPSKFKTNLDCKDHSTIDGVVLCPSNPVESISKIEIDSFIKRLNSYTNKKYRLPSEFEWEHSVADSMVHNLKLNQKDAKDFTSIGNETKRTISVFSKKEINNGLVLTAGNVWEVTSTEYNKFEFSGIDKKSDKDHFVIKGGGWNSSFDHARRSYIGKLPMKLKSPDVGFRLAL